MEIKECCGNCKNFIQHYVIINAKFAPIDRGHCTEHYRNKKLLAADRAGCEMWEFFESAFKHNKLEYYLENFLIDAVKIAEVLEVLYKRK